MQAKSATFSKSNCFVQGFLSTQSGVREKKDKYEQQNVASATRKNVSHQLFFNEKM